MQAANGQCRPHVAVSISNDGNLQAREHRGGWEGSARGFLLLLMLY